MNTRKKSMDGAEVVDVIKEMIAVMQKNITDKIDVTSNSLQAEMFQVHQKLEIVIKANEKLEKQMEAVKAENKELLKRCEDLEVDMDRLEQKTLANELTIEGEIEINELMLEEKLVGLINEKFELGKLVAIKEGDIIDVRKIHIKDSSSGKRKYQLNLKSEAKLNILRHRRNLKGKNMYVNEVLTRYRQGVFASARRALKGSKLFAVWVRNANIFVKDKEASKPYILESNIS